MSLEIVRHALLWCSIINYAILILWSLSVLFAHDWLYRLWGRWFRLSVEQFDLINIAGLTFYKTSILLFNIIPCISLYLVA